MSFILVVKDGLKSLNTIFSGKPGLEHTDLFLKGFLECICHTMNQNGPRDSKTICTLNTCKSTNSYMISTIWDVNRLEKLKKGWKKILKAKSKTKVKILTFLKFFYDFEIKWKWKLRCQHIFGFWGCKGQKGH